MHTIRYSEIIHRANRMAHRLNILPERAAIRLVEDIVKDTPVTIEVEHHFKTSEIPVGIIYAVDRVVKLDREGKEKTVIRDRKRDTTIQDSKPWVVLKFSELKMHAIALLDREQSSLAVGRKIYSIIAHTKKHFMVHLEADEGENVPNVVLYAVDMFVSGGVIKKDRINGAS